LRRLGVDRALKARNTESDSKHRAPTIESSWMAISNICRDCMSQSDMSESKRSMS